MLFYSMRRFFWYQIYVSKHLALPIYEFLKVAGLQFGCDSSKIIKFDCFWPFVVVKRQLGNVICAILVALMEINRLVPWLRQSDHPIDRNIMRAARTHARAGQA